MKTIYVIHPTLYPTRITQEKSVDENDSGYSLWGHTGKRFGNWQPRMLGDQQIVFETHDAARDELLKLARERVEMLRQQLREAQADVSTLEAM